MPRFILVRHGESLWNGERRIQGNQDPALSPRGRRQVALLAARLRAHLPTPVAGIYTSPLRRAAETAQRIAEAFGLPVVPEPDFREMGLGAWEGLTVAEVRAAFPGAYERWLEDPATFPPPGGECLKAFSARVVRAFESAGARHAGADVVVVSHGGVIKALLCHVLGLNPGSLFRIKQDNTAVSQVELDGEVRRVVLVNDTCHLSGAGAGLVPRDVLTDAEAEGTTF